MKIRIFAYILLSILFVACTTESPGPKETVINSYLALDQEDANLYMTTVTGNRAVMASSLLAGFFEDYDVSYTIDSIEVVSEDKKRAEVFALVSARDEGGPKLYHDNKTATYHKLHLMNGKWKIESTVIDEFTFLEQKRKNNPTIADTASAE